MKQVKEEIRLKNIYHGTIVYAKDYDDVTMMNGMEFVRVYEEANPQRTYLANKAAFVKLDK